MKNLSTRRKAADTEAFIYVIAFAEKDVFTAPVKVGISHDPASRLANLQTASPHELGLVAKLEFPNREIARQLEDCFHQTHAQHRMRGEWFDMPPHHVLSILRLQARFALDMLTSMSEEEQHVAIEMIEAHL